MIRRRLNFWCRLTWHEYVIGFPGIVLEILGTAGSPYKLVRDIRVMDAMADIYPYFVAFIERAVRLIANADPRRFQRVQREIRRIANARGGGVVYCRPFKTLLIDFRCFYPLREREAMVKLLAMVMIDAATRGAIFSRGILPQSDPKGTGRLCRREVRRFLERAGLGCEFLHDSGGSADVLGSSFWRNVHHYIGEILTMDPRTEAEMLRRLLEQNGGEGKG